MANFILLTRSEMIYVKMFVVRNMIQSLDFRTIIILFVIIPTVFMSIYFHVHEYILYPYITQFVLESNPTFTSIPPDRWNLRGEGFFSQKLCHMHICNHWILMHLKYFCF
ncbi:putative glycosyl transferase, family 17 [Helianthus debilis subsp. tardiflorus]